ncbi:hypothetical protein EMIT0P4_470005 [Pseudomonas sp. IT-P4]
MERDRTPLSRAGPTDGSRVTRNGTFVKLHPSSKPTLVGFFVATGHQRWRVWYITHGLCGLMRIPLLTRKGLIHDPSKHPS